MPGRSIRNEYDSPYREDDRSSEGIHQTYRSRWELTLVELEVEQVRWMVADDAVDIADGEMRIELMMRVMYVLPA